MPEKRKSEQMFANAEEMVRYIGAVQQEKDVYLGFIHRLLPPTCDVTIRIRPVSEDLLEGSCEVLPLETDVWIGCRVCFKNEAKGDVKITFLSLDLFNIEQIVVPEGMCPSLTVKSFLPGSKFAFTVDRVGTGDSPKLVIVDPPDPDS
jgi:hypothetical protein